MENWNPNDWQGRRKDQYEYSAKAVFYSVILLILISVVGVFLS
jgi:uncharacterized membrane protein YidH (DUF202 family)